MRLLDALGQKVFPNDIISPNYADAVSLVLTTALRDIPEEVLCCVGSEAHDNLAIYNKLTIKVRNHIGDVSLVRALTDAIALSYADTIREVELVTLQCVQALGIIGTLLIENDYDLSVIDLSDKKP